MKPYPWWQSISLSFPVQKIKVSQTRRKNVQFQKKLIIFLKLQPGIVAVLAAKEPFKGNPFPRLELTGAEVTLAPDPLRFNLLPEFRIFSFLSRLIKDLGADCSGVRREDWELRIPPNKSAGPTTIMPLMRKCNKMTTHFSPTTFF